MKNSTVFENLLHISTPLSANLCPTDQRSKPRKASQLELSDIQKLKLSDFQKLDLSEIQKFSAATYFQNWGKNLKASLESWQLVSLLRELPISLAPKVMTANF